MATSSGARLPWQPLPEDDKTPEAPIESRPGDFTSRLTKEQRALHDSDDADAAEWLRTYGRQSTGDYTWK